MNGTGTAAAIASAPVVAARAPRGAWVQVVLASVLMLATFPGRTHGLGLFTEPLLADLHLDRLTYANMNLWATLLGALFCFPAGWAIDRLGLRWVTAFIVLMLGIIVWRFSAVTASVTLTFVLLLATRAFGQSALSVCSIATVAKWFPQRAGLAMGVYSVLLSVFFAAAFVAVGGSVSMRGWRAALAQIAMALVFVVAPLMLVMLRQPKGNAGSPQPAVAPSLEGGSENTEPRHPDFTLAQALRTKAFWLFAGAAAAFNLVSSGLLLFNESVLKEHGFDRETFYHFQACSALLSLVGQFLCGWLTRRWSYHSLTCAALVLYALGLAGIPFLTQHWQLWCLAVLLGVAGGMMIVIFFSVWSDLFGQQHLGRIQGAAQMVTVLSSGLGPVLFAWCVVANGSYSPLLFALAGVVLLLAFVAKATRHLDPT